MHSIEFRMDFMNAILARHEPDGIFFHVDDLDEAVILVARGTDDLKCKMTVVVIRAKIRV